MAGNQVNDIILQAELHKTTFSMRLIPAITAAAALALTACSTNSVTISYEGGKTRVEAYSANILRVTSVPEGADFIDGKSLMALKPQRKIRVNVTKDDPVTTVKAPGITAVVDNSDGRVSFFRPDWTELTAEHCRSFTPITVNGDKAWTVSQSFDSPEDEAFYGLGQHQMPGRSWRAG